MKLNKWALPLAVALMATAFASVAGDRIAANRTTPKGSAERIGESRAYDSTGAAQRVIPTNSPSSGSGSANTSTVTMVESYRGNPDPSPKVAEMGIFDDGWVAAQVLFDNEGGFTRRQPFAGVAWDKHCHDSAVRQTTHQTYGDLFLTQGRDDSARRWTLRLPFNNAPQRVLYSHDNGDHLDFYILPSPSDSSWVNTNGPAQITTKMPVLAGDSVRYETIARVYAGCFGETREVLLSDARWSQDQPSSGGYQMPTNRIEPDRSYQATVKLVMTPDPAARTAATCPAFRKTYTAAQRTCNVDAPATLMGESWSQAGPARGAGCQYTYSCRYDSAKSSSSWLTEEETFVDRTPTDPTCGGNTGFNCN